MASCGASAKYIIIINEKKLNVELNASVPILIDWGGGGGLVQVSKADVLVGAFLKFCV